MKFQNRNGSIDSDDRTKQLYTLNNSLQNILHRLGLVLWPPLTIDRCIVGKPLLPRQQNPRKEVTSRDSSRCVLDRGVRDVDFGARVEPLPNSDDLVEGLEVTLELKS